MPIISKKLKEALAPIVKFMLMEGEGYKVVDEILNNDTFRKELIRLEWANLEVKYLQALEEEFPEGLKCPDCGSKMSVDIECAMAKCLCCNEEIRVPFSQEHEYILENTCKKCVSYRMKTCALAPDGGNNGNQDQEQDREENRLRNFLTGSTERKSKG